MESYISIFWDLAESWELCLLYELGHYSLHIYKVAHIGVSD